MKKRLEDFKMYFYSIVIILGALVVVPYGIMMVYEIINGTRVIPGRGIALVIICFALKKYFFA